MFLLLDCTAKLHQLFRNGLSSLLHDLLKLTGVTLVAGLEEGMAHARLTSAASSANAMDVVLNGKGKGEVEHHLHVGDIKTTSSDIGGHHKGTFAALELLQGTGAGILGLVAMDTGAIPAVALELILKTLGLLLVEGKDEDPVCAVAVILVEELTETGVASTVFDDLHGLGNALIGREGIINGILPIAADNRFEADVNADGVDQIFKGDLLNDGGPCGGKHGRLPLLLVLGLANDKPYILLEAHVEHSVSLIEHELRHVAQIDGILADEILQPTGSGHDAVHALA
mmetsp:Transcript_1168/g.3324  ORF Transcript_1168/g.3324 Transcript_1168/m.3324 type:complete len:285 (+) Transcript_1168:1144-1998(+)